MNRFEFGALVASLREDMRWTQLELAEKSGLDVSVISNIERGARRTLLKDNMLVKLADGFLLTSMERQEFLFAASGVTELEAVRKENQHEKKQFNPLKLAVMVGMAIATSIDALVVGVSFAFIDVNIVIAIIIIGTMTFFVSMLGMLLGKKAGSLFGRKMEIIGGLILIIIGSKILIEHLIV